MSTLGFDTNQVKQAYLGSGTVATQLTALRSSTTVGQSLSTLDSQVEEFENAITPTALPAGKDQSTYPYNQQGLMNQFLDQFVGLLYQQDQQNIDSQTDPNGSTDNQTQANTWANSLTPTYVKKTTTYTANPIKNSGGTVTGYNAVDNDLYAVNSINSNDPAFVGNAGTTPADPNNTGNGLTIANALLNNLTTAGQNLVKQYAVYISSVFAQGQTLANNPTDPVTGNQVVTSDVVAIPPIVINGVTYDHTASVNGAVVYLQQGTQTYTADKFKINNTNNQPYDVGLGFQPPGFGNPATVPPDSFVVAYYSGKSENLNVLNSTTSATTSTFENFNLPVGSNNANVTVHLATDGNLYTLQTQQNSNSQYPTTATYTPTAITPFSANGVQVDRQVTINNQNFYVAADNSKLIPSGLISQTQAATSENFNLDTSTASTQSFSVGGQNLRLGADGNFYGIQLDANGNPVKDANGNLVVTATYTAAQIPQTVVDGISVNRVITVGTQAYYVASDNSQLILKSYPAENQSGTIATGSTTTATLTQAFTVAASTGTVNLNYATDGNFYTLKLGSNGQPVTDANGNYEIGTTYTATPINPFQLANGVSVNRTIQIGSQYFYVAADNSQIVPEPTFPAQSEIFPTNSAVTNSPVTAATVASVTQSVTVPGVTGGKLYIGSDQNVYALQVDSTGQPIKDANGNYEVGTAYATTSIVPTTIDGVTVNRTINVAGKIYYVAANNSEVIFKSYAATGETANLAVGNGLTVPLSESYPLPTATLHLAGDGNLYTVQTNANGQPITDSNGNYQIANTYTPTPINPVVLANGVLVNRTIQIGTQYFYVAADNSQIVPEPVHPGQSEISSTAVTTTNLTLKQAYTVPGVPGQLHYASDNKFYSLQLDANGNPVLNAQNQYQVNATYITTVLSPPVTVAGVVCDRTMTVGSQVYYVGENDPTTGAPSALVPADLLSQTLPTTTGSGTIATTTTLTPAYPVPGVPLGIYSSPDGKFYSLEVDSNGNPIKDTNGNDLIGNTYPVTTIPTTTVNGVSVNGTITVAVKGTTNLYYVATDGRHLVAPGSSTSSPVTTQPTLQQKYTLPGVPGGLHLASDGNFYSLQLDGNGNPILNAQNQYQLGTAYTPTFIVSMSVAGITVNRSISVAGQTYYVASDNSQLVPATLASPSLTVPVTITPATNVATTVALTKAYSVATTLGQTNVHYSPTDGNFYTVQTDVKTGQPVVGADGNYQLNATSPPTQITPTTINGIPVNRTITVYGTTYYVATDNSQLVLPVTTPPTPQTAKAVRNMDVMEFIYYWNEAKMHVLKSQLAYQNDITQLMQDNLRQANAAMADLTQQSSQTKQNDSSSGNPDPDSSAQTVAFHLFAAENQTESTANNTTTGTVLPVFFDATGTNPENSGFGPFTLSNSQWQKARVGLQNFIDRRTADAQSAMVDYQNTLNTFNNNYNTMSQLQQTLETLLTQELKNWV